MNLKKFTEELITEWRNLLEDERGLNAVDQHGLNGVIENKETGLKGEKSALRKLRNEIFGYEFTLTPNSWSPADIIGFKKDSSFWHFSLYQVKTSVNEQNLTSQIIEKDTLPILAKLLKSVYRISDQTKYYKKKPVYITTGYLGVHNKNGRNTIVKKIPYQKDFKMNGLHLTSSEKTVIRNYAHK